MSDHPPTTKIFGIGLNKTGTSTLGACGRLLGLRCKSSDRKLLEDFRIRGDFTRIHETISNHDLFEDWPWPLIYKELDEQYPGSKFILTTRKNSDVWFDSLVKQSLITSPKGHCRKLAYGHHYPHDYKQEHVDFYHRHNQEVREHFAGRTSDFIEMCWENGDDFDKLCAFLGMEKPTQELPHSNKSSERKPKLRRVITNSLLRYILR